MPDADDLARFEDAQAPVMGAVQAELTAGRKTSHWMWFVFPQLRGLGRSGMATHYGIASLAEAERFLAHAVLGPRLRDCVALVLAAGRPAFDIFGEPDTSKLRSCLTLFEAAGERAFGPALDRLFDSERDAATLRLLRGSVGGDPLR